MKRKSPILSSSQARLRVRMDARDESHRMMAHAVKSLDEDTARRRRVRFAEEADTGVQAESFAVPPASVEREDEQRRAKVYFDRMDEVMAMDVPDEEKIGTLAEIIVGEVGQSQCSLFNDEPRDCWLTCGGTNMLHVSPPAPYEFTVDLLHAVDMLQDANGWPL